MITESCTAGGPQVENRVYLSIVPYATFWRPIIVYILTITEDDLL